MSDSLRPSAINSQQGPAALWGALPDSMQSVALRLAALAILCLLLSLASEAFFTTSNILNVLRQAALLFLLASGLTLVILTAGLDLSVGANVALSACLAATLIKGTGSIAIRCCGRIEFRLADWHCQRVVDHLGADSAFHRHLWHALDSSRHHLLVHERGDDSRFSPGVSGHLAVVIG